MSPLSASPVYVGHVNLTQNMRPHSYIRSSRRVAHSALQRVLNAVVAAARVVSGTHKLDRGLSRLFHTDYRATLVGCSRASRVQTRRHGVQLHARSSASVPRGIVPTSRRCRITATSSIRHPTAPGRTASPAQLLWPTGFLCNWSVGLEFPAGQLAESDYWREQFQTISEDVSVRYVLMHSAH